MTRYFMEFPTESSGRNSKHLVSCACSPDKFTSYVDAHGRMVSTYGGNMIAELQKPGGKYFLAWHPLHGKAGITIEGPSRARGEEILQEMLTCGLREVEGSDVIKTMAEAFMQTFTETAQR